MEAELKMHALSIPEKNETGGSRFKMAQAYVCPQPLENVFPPEEGLCKGTAFPNLSQPYGGWKRLPLCGSEVSI